MSDTENRERAEAHKYPNVVRFVRETPWAIIEPKLHEIRQMLELHVRGHVFTAEEIEARIGAGPARRDAYETSGSVAVIPIYGVITPRADLMTEISGGTSIDRLQSSLRQAVADPKIKSILLDVNSPGGSVAMLNEMASELRQARRVKPVVAVANTMAASAAYQLASQASEFVVTPSGSVGSIGTIATHDDISAALHQEGVKTTVVTAGKYKAELSPYGPLSDDAKAELQSTVDKYYAMFVQDVARGRGVTVDKVRSDFGQGRMLMAKDALAAGMVDRVDTLDNVLASMEKSAGAQAQGARAITTVTVTDFAEGKMMIEGLRDAVEEEFPEAALSGLSFADEAIALHDGATALVGRARSLAEVRDRGRLTVSKRERLAACSEALRESAAEIDQLLADTAPVNHRDAAIAESARFELSRLHEGAQA